MTTHPLEPTATDFLAQQGDIAFQANLYDDPNPTRRGLHCARRDWVQDRLARYVENGSRVLEIGVGCGIFTRHLTDKGAKVMAVDVNQAFLDGVSDLSDVEVLNADATRDFGARNIDVALLSEVLEHVPRDGSVGMLQTIYDALKPGGVLVLTTPQRFSTMELTARLLKLPPVLALARKIYGTADELGHINLLTSGALKKQIAAAGFETVEEDLFGFYLPGVAEFGGEAGAGLLQRTGRLFKKTPVLRHLIWTQGYVLRKPLGA